MQQQRQPGPQNCEPENGDWLIDVVCHAEKKVI